MSQIIPLLDVDDFRNRIVDAYNRGTGDAELPADLSTARSLIPPGTGALRDFSYIAPVSSRWGFTVSGSRSEQYQDSRTMLTTWRGASGATNGGTLPDTTPDRPYLTDYSFTHGPRTESRSSAGATIDLRAGPSTRLSLAVHRVDFGAE